MEAPAEGVGFAVAGELDVLVEGGWEETVLAGGAAELVGGAAELVGEEAGVLVESGVAGTGGAEGGRVVDGWAVGAGGGTVFEMGPWLVDEPVGAGAAEACGDAEGFEETGGDEIFPEGVAEGFGDDPSEQVAEVGVEEGGAGRGEGGAFGFETDDVLALGGEREGGPVFAIGGEPGAVGEEVADGDAGEFRGGVLEEGREEFGDGVVPVELAGLDPCADERGGHGFGHGAEVPEVGDGGGGGVVAFADPGDAGGGEA